MSYLLPITQLRRNIFEIMEKVARTGEEIEVEKEGKRIVKIVPVRDDPAAKAKYALKYVLPKLAGIWNKVPERQFKELDKFMRGKREKLYWKRKKFQ